MCHPAIEYGQLYLRKIRPYGDTSWGTFKHFHYLSLSFTRFLTSSHVKLIPNATSQVAHSELQLQVAQVPDPDVMCSSLAGPGLFCSANIMDVPCDEFRGERHV